MEPDNGGGDGGEDTVLRPDPGGYGAEEWFAAIGELVIAFEQLCANCRLYLGGALPGRERKDWERKIAVVSHLGAAELRKAVGAFYERGGMLDTAQEKRVGQAGALKQALRDFQKLIEFRNQIVHSDWSFFPANDFEPDAEVNATEIVASMPNRGMSGPAWEERRFTYEQVQDAIELAYGLRRRLFTLGSLMAARMQRHKAMSDEAQSAAEQPAKPPHRP